MATIVNGLLKGRLGDQVYSIRNGKNYVRPVRKVTTFSEGMLARQALFARAGKMCKVLKPELQIISPQVEKHLVQSRLMSGLVRWVHALDSGQLKNNDSTAFFTKCSFRPGHSVPENWRRGSPVLTRGNGFLPQLHIPSCTPTCDMRAPNHTTQVQCTISVAGAMAGDGTFAGSCNAGWLMEYNDEPTQERIIDLPVDAPEGSLLLMAMSLHYTLYGRGSNAVKHDKRFMPAGIVGALYV